MNAPATYSVDTLCKLLDLTPRRIRQLTDEGVVFKISRGQYDLVKSVRGYIAHLRERLEKTVAGGDDGGLSRKRMADALMAELEYQTRKGERVIAGDVDEMMQRVAMTVRTNVLAVPAKVAPLINPKTTRAQVEAIVRTAIDDALLALTTIETKSA